MNWEQYEVWAIGHDGFEQLIESTRSLSQAKNIAKALIEQDYAAADVFKENEDGEPALIASFNRIESAGQ